eukprot:1312841-Rhodomonas_salina.2
MVAQVCAAPPRQLGICVELKAIRAVIAAVHIRGGKSLLQKTNPAPRRRSRTAANEEEQPTGVEVSIGTPNEIASARSLVFEFRTLAALGVSVGPKCRDGQGSSCCYGAMFNAAGVGVWHLLHFSLRSDALHLSWSCRAALARCLTAAVLQIHYPLLHSFLTLFNRYRPPPSIIDSPCLIFVSRRMVAELIDLDRP